MKIHEILTEKIIVQPINQAVYFGNRAKRLLPIIAAVEHAKAVIKGSDGEGDYLLDYAIRNLLPDDRRLHAPNDYAVDLNRHYELERLHGNLDGLAKFGVNQFLKYAIGTLADLKPVDQDTRDYLALIPRVEEGFREYGFEPGTHDNEPEYRSARALADAYLIIRSALPVVETMIAELRGVFADIQKRQQLMYEPHKYRPDHEQVEILYHASLYADQIVRDGFAAEKPEGRHGLGFSQGQEKISFTHQLKIAHDISRSLKDMWMIVHGEISRRQIIGWIKAEGLDLNNVSSLYMKRDQPLDSIEQVLNLYLGYIGYSKIRTNPVFVSAYKMIEPMKNGKLSDIGIVSCPVRLDGNEEYLPGEAEFRVTASQVVGPIKRLV